MARTDNPGRRETAPRHSSGLLPLEVRSQDHPEPTLIGIPLGELHRMGLDPAVRHEPEDILAAFRRAVTVAVWVCDAPPADARTGELQGIRPRSRISLRGSAITWAAHPGTPGARAVGHAA